VTKTNEIKAAAAAARRRGDFLRLSRGTHNIIRKSRSRAFDKALLKRQQERRDGYVDLLAAEQKALAQRQKVVAAAGGMLLSIMARNQNRPT